MTDINFTAAEAIQDLLDTPNHVPAIHPDGWNFSGHVAGRVDWTDEFGPEAWVVRGAMSDYPALIEISGRKIRYESPIGTAVRCRITFLQDGEPNVETHGWLKVGRY